MKINLIAASVALAMTAGMSVAIAQQTVVVQPQPTVVIQPQQETVIREYVHKQPPLASIDLPGISLDIGSPLPDTVELHRIEAPDVQYQYVVIGGKTYIVDPGTRQIIQVLN